MSETPMLDQMVTSPLISQERALNRDYKQAVSFYKDELKGDKKGLGLMAQ